MSRFQPFPSGYGVCMSTEHEYEPLTDEELESQHAEEIPEREAMSVLGLPVVGPGGGIPIEPPEPPLDDV